MTFPMPLDGHVLSFARDLPGQVDRAGSISWRAVRGVFRRSNDATGRWICPPSVTRVVDKTSRVRALGDATLSVECSRAVERFPPLDLFVYSRNFLLVACENGSSGANSAHPLSGAPSPQDFPALHSLASRRAFVERLRRS